MPRRRMSYELLFDEPVKPSDKTKPVFDDPTRVLSIGATRREGHHRSLSSETSGRVSPVGVCLRSISLDRDVVKCIRSPV